MVTHRIFRLLCRTCTPAVALSAALAGCVSPGTEGPVSTVMDHSTDIAARRDALRTVQVVDKAPAGSTKVDALAMAVAFWTDNMARDEDAAVAALVEKKRDDELRKFMEAFSKTSGTPTGWIKV